MKLVWFHNFCAKPKLDPFCLAHANPFIYTVPRIQLIFTAWSGVLSCHMECNALCSSCQPAKITCLTPQLITSAHRQNTFYLAINKDHFKSHTLAFYVDVCFCVFDVFLCVLLSSNHSLLSVIWYSTIALQVRAKKWFSVLLMHPLQIIFWSVVLCIKN